MPVEDRKTEAAFVTWDDERDKKDVVASVQDVLEAYDGVQRASASTTRTFLDLEPNRSVRVGFSTKDYSLINKGVESETGDQFAPDITPDRVR